MPQRLTSVEYTIGEDKINALHASASLSEDGVINLSLANVHPGQAVELPCLLQGTEIQDVSGSILTAPEINSHNTFDDPDVVIKRGFDDFSFDKNRLRVNLPAKSIVVLKIIRAE